MYCSSTADNTNTFMVPLQSKVVFTVIRHAKQTDIRLLDPPIIGISENITGSFNLIITSPYLRCRQTALSLNRSNSRIFVDTRICEYQCWYRKKRGQMDPDSCIYGDIPLIDETWDQFSARIDHFIEDLRKGVMNGVYNGNILIVSHGLVVNYLSSKSTIGQQYKRGRDVPHLGGFTFTL